MTLAMAEEQIRMLEVQRDDYKRQGGAYSARIGRMNEERKALKDAMLDQVVRLEEATDRIRELVEYGP